MFVEKEVIVTRSWGIFNQSVIRRFRGKHPSFLWSETRQIPPPHPDPLIHETVQWLQLTAITVLLLGRINIQLFSSQSARGKGEKGYQTGGGAS